MGEGFFFFGGGGRGGKLLKGKAAVLGRPGVVMEAGEKGHVVGL